MSIEPVPVTCEHAAGDPELLSHVELMRDCLNTGSEDAWTEFVRRYNRFVCLAVVRALAQHGGPKAGEVDRDRVNDLVQDVYVKLFENSRSGREFRGSGDAAVFTYIACVANSVIVDHLRRNAARKRAATLCSLDAPISAEDEGECSLLDLMVAPGPGPEREALAEVLRGEVSAILGRTLRGRNAARDAGIVEAFLFEDSSPGEIAHTFADLQESSIKSTLRRTSARVRREVARLERLAARRAQEVDATRSLQTA